MRSLLHEVSRGLDVLQTHVLRAGDVDEHTARAVDGGFHERAGDGHAGGVFRLALAGGMSHAHVREARVLHDAGNVGKVEVDEAGVLDEVGDAGNGLTQHVVGDLERVRQRDLLVGGVFQAIVRDDQQGVHLAEQLVDADHGLIHAALALKLEGLGHHADGEDAGLAGDIRDGRRRARAGAAAHTGGDEHHIGVLQALGDVVAALLRAALAHFGVAAGALTMGQLFADLNLLVGAGDGQGLLIRIYCDVLNSLSPGFDHSVDNVIACAAHTNDFDGDDIFRTGFGSIGHNRFLPVSICIWFADGPRAIFLFILSHFISFSL